MGKRKKKDRRPKVIRELETMSKEEILLNKDKLKRQAKLFEGSGLLIGLIIFIIFLLIGDFSISW